MGSNNLPLADNGNNDTDSSFAIKDFGDIRFAENDRLSKYVRIPFTPVLDNLEAPVVPLMLRKDSSECLDNIDVSNRLTSADLIRNVKKQKTTAACIVNLMSRGWKLPPPQLIISVTGGARLFKLATPRARYAFQRGLIAAAITTDAWIITGGAHAGVMKEVGDAVDKQFYKNTKTPLKVQCIGITSWYFTTDHQYLVQKRPSPRQSLSNPLHSTISVQPRLALPLTASQNNKNTSPNSVMSQISGAAGPPAEKHESLNLKRTRIYRSRAPLPKEVSCPLDPNHTHFILLDDMLGENIEITSNELIQHVNCRADLTIKLRAEIEREASDSYCIPIVQILANGGASSILTVCKALQQKTPVIVIEGTGRAADEIAREYKHLYGNQPTNYEEHRSSEVYDKASLKFDDFERRIRSSSGPDSILNHTNCEQFIKRLTSREGYFLISTFQFHNEQGDQKLDDAILNALFNAARIMKTEDDQRTTELKLAIAWNKFDRIRRNILTDKTILKWTDIELDGALRDSLRMNKVRFVDLLIEYGASFDRLQRFNLLEKLYQETETSVLEYSEPMNQNIHRWEKSFNWKKPNKKYFYEDYLRIDINDKQKLSINLLNESSKLNSNRMNKLSKPSALVTNYGNLDDNNMSTNSGSSFDQPICVFNAIDMIQVNGFLNTISIRFDYTKPFSSNHLLLCYLISPTNDPNLFVIAHKCSLQSISSNSTNFCHYKTADKRLFVTNGQFIAIGFTHRTGFPYNVSQRNQHSLSLDEIEHLPAKKPVQFNVETSQGVAISFSIVSSPEFCRDLFFWSLFFNRHYMATYLCSKSSNTILAALFASKIYQQAASFTSDAEKRLDLIGKEKEFDKHASTIMDMCFSENDQFAVHILEKPSPLFFNKNPLQIAKEINSRAFLATKTVQRYLDQKWYGHVDKYGDHNLFGIDTLVFIMCILPFLIAIPALSNILINPEKRQPKPWEEKPHIIGWSARIFYRFKEFYRERAMVRFYYNIVFYILFLTLFSFVLLVDYFPLNINGGQRNGYEHILIPITEMFVHILIWSLIFEEGKEFYEHWKEEKENRNRYIMRNYYMQNQWNILDLFAIVIYLLAFITRFIVIENAFIASKILMCIDLFLWYVRILQLFAAYKRLGPKLLMIFNTMKDLVFFIYFILIFLAGYSITSYALIITKYQVFWEDSQGNHSTREFKVLNNGTGLWNWEILRHLIQWGVWKIYGQADLETAYHNNTDVAPDNDAYGIVAYIFTIVFVCIANVLLLNVLVALFNVSIQKVENKAHESWAYHRFLLVTEYNNKTFLPPPLSILGYAFEHLYRFFENSCSKKTNNTYGIHDDSHEDNRMDSNLFDMVVFNAEDRIHHSTGFINSVTINFSSPPLIYNPSITLYLLSSEGNISNMFHIDDEQPLAMTNSRPERKDIHTFVFDTPLRCHQGQFVALAFGPHSGSPASIKTRNEHSVNLIQFLTAKHQNQPIVFTNYPNKGAAFSFTIDQLPESPYNQVTIISTRETRLDSIPCIEMNESERYISHNRQMSNPSKVLPRSLITTQNKYEDRDNMLRESSVAEDYWKYVIDEIKQQEAKIAEEQIDTKLPAVDSVHDKSDVKKPTTHQLDDSDHLVHKF